MCSTLFQSVKALVGVADHILIVGIWILSEESLDQVLPGWLREVNSNATEDCHGIYRLISVDFIWLLPPILHLANKKNMRHLLETCLVLVQPL